VSTDLFLTITSKRTEIHHIRPCVLEHARSADDAMMEFLRFIEISERYYDAQISTIPQRYIDLCFDTILKKYNISNMGAHNAVNDAVMSAMMFLKLKGAKK